MSIHYKFPEITHINQVLETIKDRPEFIVVDKGEYTVINYVVAGADTFPEVLSNEQNAILRECRGIIFDNETGRVIARRFHKFFNLGEREELRSEYINLNIPHSLPVKLDGSMITPIPLKEGIRWGTKMGVTDVALQAEAFVEAHPEYLAFAEDQIRYGYTPIFEWCSNKQRIVIDHAQDSLVLLAIRDNVSGEYICRADVENEAARFGIPVVSLIEKTNDIAELHERIRAQEGAEGVVVTFDNGHMIKIKSDWYVRLHKTKDAISSERKIVDLLVNGGLDDLKPLMDPADYEKVLQYDKDFTASVSYIAANLYKALNRYRVAGMTRKEFALGDAADYNKIAVSIIFKFWDVERLEARQVLEMVFDRIMKATNTNKNFDSVKEAFFPQVVYGLDSTIEDE